MAECNVWMLILAFIVTGAVAIHFEWITRDREDDADG